MKVVVDARVWISYFNGVSSAETDRLHESLAKDLIILGDIVFLEILQGIRDDAQYRKTKTYLKATTQVQMINPSLAVSYADYYRALRKKGITIRKTNGSSPGIVLLMICLSFKMIGISNLFSSIST